MKNITKKIKNKKIFKGITLTKNASTQMLHLINKNSKNKGVRLNIKKSGCAGFRIIMELAQEKKEEEIELFQNGIILFISKKILKILEGMEIDFIEKDFNKTFQFKHSNEKNHCGCGESFEL